MASTPSTLGPPPSMQQAIDEWGNLYSQGQSKANAMFAPGTLGTITDPRSADMQSYINSLKGGAPLAAQEQGIAAINKDQAMNQEKVAGIAGGQGLSGAASAGLQMKTLSNANQSMADYMRGLAINNQQQLGSALQNQQQTELAIENTNNGLRNQEKYGQAAYPLQYASAISSLHSGDMANYLSQQGIQQSQNLISQLAAQTAGQPGGGTPGAAGGSASGSSGSSGGSAGPAPLKWTDDTKVLDTNIAGHKTMIDSGGGQHELVAASLVPSSIDQSKLATTTDPTDGTKYVDLSSAADNNTRLKDEDAINQKSYDDYNQQHGTSCGPNGICYVVTASTKAGFVSPEFLRAVTAKCPTKRENVAAYKMWGPVMAKGVETSRFVRWLVRNLMPATVNFMRGEKSAKGAFGYYSIYMPLSLACRAYLWVMHGR